MALRLRRIEHINQKCKDTVSGYIKKSQLMFPKDNPYYNIVDLIQHFILLYFYQKFESNILTDDEQDIFTNLWIDNDKQFIDNDWKLIYRGSRDGFDRESAVNKIYDNQNVILLIDTENGNAFGGYTKTGWNSRIKSYKHTPDRDAFVFQIRSSNGYKPFISNVEKDEDSIRYSLGHNNGSLWGLFGLTWIFGIRYDAKKEKTTVFNEDTDNYEQFEHSRPFLGGMPVDNVVDVEAFQMIDVKIV